MRDYNKLYELWRDDPYFDSTIREDLAAICDDEKEIEERFYRELSFGTGGLRGIIGAGTNRVNVHTVAKAAAGLAQYIKAQGQVAADAGVVISYDSRRFSLAFAQTAACVLTRGKIRVHLSDTLRTVPQLSFGVRYHQAFAGIMITASHNPPEYNGLKVYGSDGGQVTLEAADEILGYMNAVEDIRTIEIDTMKAAVATGRLSFFGPEMDEAYESMLESLLCDRASIQAQCNMPIVFTPLYGTANVPVRRILKRVGFDKVYVVSEQERPDPDFPSLKTPNPEDPAALKKAIELADKVGATLVIGTDPDGDRVGVAVRAQNGSMVTLTGNQVGLLLLDYILSSKKENNELPQKSFAVTTIVSSKLAKAICDAFEVELQEVLTGFKFIGERIMLDDEKGDKHFQFGFEESYGYLVGRDVRDKDGIVASLFIAAMAAQSLQRGQTLEERLMNLFTRYGYAKEEAVSFVLQGKAGVETIEHTMQTLRSDIKKIATKNDLNNLLDGLEVSGVRDYASGERIAVDGPLITRHKINLPSANVILYELGGEKNLDWACVRPSGTEPKLKVYVGAYKASDHACEEAVLTYKKKLTQRVEALFG